MARGVETFVRDFLRPSMKSDYWNVSDEQVREKTGKTLLEWAKILTAFNATARPSSEVVAYLQGTHSVPRYWARTLTTRYLKDNKK